jgi:hypothetical protein
VALPGVFLSSEEKREKLKSIFKKIVCAKKPCRFVHFDEIGFHCQPWQRKGTILEGLHHNETLVSKENGQVPIPNNTSSILIYKVFCLRKDFTIEIKYINLESTSPTFCWRNCDIFLSPIKSLTFIART